MDGLRHNDVFQQSLLGHGYRVESSQLVIKGSHAPGRERRLKVYYYAYLGIFFRDRYTANSYIENGIELET